jgi:hypothetical protein
VTYGNQQPAQQHAADADRVQLATNRDRAVVLAQMITTI